MPSERKTAEEMMETLKMVVPYHPETWHVDRDDAIRIAEEYAAQEASRLHQRIAALEEALTPSGATKAAYMGETGATWVDTKALMRLILDRAEPPRIVFKPIPRGPIHGQ